MVSKLQTQTEIGIGNEFLLWDMVKYVPVKLSQFGLSCHNDKWTNGSQRVEGVWKQKQENEKQLLIGN